MMENYYQIKAKFLSEADLDIYNENILRLTKEFYLFRKKNILKWQYEVFRIHIFHETKIKILIGINYMDIKRKYIVEKLLKNYYGELAVVQSCKPNFSKKGRTLVAVKPLYLINTKNFIENIIQFLPRNIVLTIDFKANDKLRKYITDEDRYLKEKKEFLRDTYNYEHKIKDIKQIKDSKYLFNLDIYVNAINENNQNNIYAFCKKLTVMTDGGVNSIKAKIFSNGLHPDRKLDFNYKSKIIATEYNVADILTIPSYDKYPQLLYNAAPEVDAKMFCKGILIGEHIADDNTKFDFRVSLEQLSKHMFLCAGTGGGKSSLLFTFLDDLLMEHKQKYGATIIDPNEETLVKFVNHALYMEKQGYKIDWNKIHYIDLVNGEYLPSLNLLNIPYAESDIDIIQSYIMETLKAVYPAGSTPRIDEQLRNVIGTLLLEKRKNTVLDANKLLTDPRRQKQVSENIGDGYYEQTYKNIWKTSPKASDVDSTMRRLNLFQSPQMQRIYGLPEFDLPIREWLDKGHIILINTKGLSQEKLILNAGHILSQYVMVAKTRGTSGTLPHFLIIDEGKQFQLPIIWKNIIPEARKFGLFLIETTQTITSLLEPFKNEIIENVDTIVSGRLGDTGAKIVSKMMNDTVRPYELKNMQDFNLLAYTRGKDKKIVTAKIKVNPPYWYFISENTCKIARYKNFKEEREAELWTRQKIQELQKRDWRHISILDQLLKKRYGSPQRKKVQRTQNTETIF